MANNATPSADPLVATDQLADTSHVQLIKLVGGVENSIERIGGDAANGLDVDPTRLPDIVAVHDRTRVEGGGTLPMKRVWIKATSGADREVVAAVTGKKIRVHGLVVTLTTDEYVTFKSAGTTIVNGVPMKATAPVSIFAPFGFILETGVNEALNINPGTADAGVLVIYSEVA
ncbi:MAG TPA: hypothetical protein VK176_16565 [Phycisphaerales bacterium]|nr:hypothetical protein [Phycisphaerales bacterium]